MIVMKNKDNVQTILPTTTKELSSDKTEFDLLIEKKEDQQAMTSINTVSPVNGVMIAEITSVSKTETEVQFSNKNAIVVAQSMVEISELDVGSQCAVMFQQGLIQQPIIMGLLVEPVVSLKYSNPTKKVEALTDIEDEYTHGTDEEESKDSTPEVLHIEAKQQIVLQCGDAILYMDADGQVEIRGNRVTTHSKGLNRIKGASVKIN